MLKDLLKRRAPLALGIALAVGGAGLNPAIAEIEDNDGYEDAYTAWAATHFALLPTSFLPGFIGNVADLATIGIDIVIKTLPAKLITEDPTPVNPQSPDGCHYNFFLPQKEAEYDNLFGIADIRSLPTNWGAFSDPQPPVVGHANAEVKVRVDNFYLEDWSESDRIVVYPSGNHPIVWEAATQLNPVIDVALPLALFYITNEVKYFKSFFEIQTDPKTAARALEIGGLFLINAGIEAGVITLDAVGDEFSSDSEAVRFILDNSFDTAVHEQRRTFTVNDLNPPVIDYVPDPGIDNDQNPVVLEANSFGGERFAVHRDRFRSWIVESDPCDAPISVGNDAPLLLEIGTNFVNWTASDLHPEGPGNPGETTFSQKIVVQDTRAPIILVPPARVIESNDPATQDDVDIGTAVVFDVADPSPALTNTAPTTFPVNSRTQVLWTATDSSGNSDSKPQWITVKAPGTNQAPLVQNVSASALTSEVVDLTLTGSDPDVVSGMFDPLKFDIVSLPGNGFFVAPLVPYFIEDYRVRPDNEVGEILNNFDPAINEIAARFCGSGGPGEVPVDFVYEPEFVHVTDEGVSFVLDERFFCSGGGGADTQARISKWSPTGDFLGEFAGSELSGAKRLTLDDSGFIYVSQPEQNDLPLIYRKLDGDLNVVDNRNLEAPSGRLLDAKTDSNTGLIFATNKQRVFVYDGRGNDFRPSLLGTLKNNESFLSGEPSVAGSSSRGFNIELDSLGNLYVVDSGDDRIHKFAPTTVDGNTLNPGAYIGWLGKCGSGPGCDDENGRSFGFSCSDATPCNVSQTSGSLPGQFNTPTGIALDPEDTLYVTDYDNSRVQRFTALGDFAGEAASVCDGSCFVLGDMGRPLDISVNSTQFYVLDRDRELMHVFETAPFKDITENSVVVSYSSDNGFQGTDSFTFRADDGLADSNVGTATITVSRNFRAPEAFDDAVVLDEDTTADVNLLASDPDGIAGVDFNGLDTLTYTVVEGPSSGTLTGSGEMRAYIPAPDFNGTDQLVFEVSDGRDVSNRATVSITVNPVNDKPVLRFMDDGSKFLPKAISKLLKGQVINQGFEAGLGFPAGLMAEYDDPDAGQAHFLTISWGDGTNDSANQTPPSDPNAPREDPIITLTAGGTGQVLGDHVFLIPGVYEVGLNVIDETGAGSESEDALRAQITVLPMVDVSLEAVPESDDPVLPGQVTTLNINVTNELPEDPVTPLEATNVVFTGVLPEGVELMSVSTSKGTCSHDMDTTTCSFGNLAPDETVALSVALLPDANFDPEAFGYQIDVDSTEQDATGDNLTVVEVPVLPQVVFQSGFE